MNWHKLSFTILVNQCLPIVLRKAKTTAFLNCIVLPLQSLSDLTLYQMQHDSRVIYLEKMLNEYFEVATYNPNSHIATRQIYIVDTPQVPKTYIYQPEENQPLYLGEVYLDRDNVTTADFIVKIPIAIEFDEPRLRAVIDFYKLAGKKYIIETY